MDFVLTQLSSMRVKVVDGTSGAPIYGVKLTLKDSSGKIVDEYTTNNEAMSPAGRLVGWDLHAEHDLGTQWLYGGYYPQDH